MQYASRSRTKHSTYPTGRPVASEPNHIRFAELKLPGGVLRGNDVPAAQYTPLRGFNVSLHVKTARDAERIFAGLSEGGTITTPLAQVPWATRFGMLVDRFGVPWLVLALGE